MIELFKRTSLRQRISYTIWTVNLVLIVVLVAFAFRS